MPSVSERQRRYLFATKGEAWVKEHGFDVLDPSARKHPSRHRRKLRRYTALTKALIK
jgi:hypothetical protein